MKAITLYQPWASLVAAEVKKFETRSWPTNYRGPIAIHASKKKPTDILTKEDVHFVRKAAYALGMEGGYNIYDVLNRLNTLPLGAVVATAELVRCDKMWDGANAGLRGAVCIDRVNQYWSPNWQVETDEFVYGDWQPGRYAWELANVKMLDKPIPARGRQGLWEWTEAGA